VARRPLEGEGLYHDGGRRTTQLMRDPLCGAPPVTTPAQAPRFQAYFERLEGKSVLSMPAARWKELDLSVGQPVIVDLTVTPLAGVVHQGQVVAAIAERSSQVSGEIRIYRFDEKDYPTPINEDVYVVWEQVTSHQSFGSIVSEASTQLNDNLKRYVSENVFLVKQQPGPDHWLPGLPDTVRVLIEKL
jgi:hypothetical protein